MPVKSALRHSVLVFAFIAAALCATQAHAEAIKSSHFLTYSEGQKHWYYAGFFDALGSWSALNDAENAQCVWGWLADKPEERKKLLDESFNAYPDHAATSVIMALVQRDCGPIMPPPPIATEN